jgi:hypothetical protein
MKNSLFIILIACGFISYAQVNTAIEPISARLTQVAHKPLELVTLTGFNPSLADSLDEIDNRTGAMPKFSRSLLTDIGLTNSGAWADVDGGRVWRVQVTAKNAQALIPYYSEFYLPEGATLHVYSADRKQMYGAFTPASNPANKLFCTGMVKGNNFIVEYFEPTESYGKGRLHINEVGYAYRMVNNSLAGRDFGDAESCEINVNCSEGNNFQNQKRATVRLLVKEGFTQGWCTGTMINNLKLDCSPYLLTADHCGEASSASDLNQWVFYFNYESPDCNNPASEGNLDNKFMTGASVRALSADNGGADGSDFMLLELNNTPPANYDVYLAGWNALNNAPATPGVCIHHPAGDIKKISTFTQAPTSNTWGGTFGTHWRVRWAATTNGHGVTEPGSSGSAIFNSAGQIVGHLTGGNSFCNTPTQPDLYGKVAYDWEDNGTANNRQLKVWLDPDNTGDLAMDGMNIGTCGQTGIANTAENNLAFSVYPNPASGVVLLNVSNAANNSTITITDNLGRQVTSFTTIDNSNLQLDLSSYAKGIYYITLTSGGKTGVQKLVVE